MHLHGFCPAAKSACRCAVMMQTLRRSRFPSRRRGLNIMWLRIVVLFLIALTTIVIALLVFGAYRWNARTQALLARLDAARVAVTPARVDLGETDALPPPVRRFFRAALTDGMPVLSSVVVEHTGMFNMSQTSEQWKPFTSRQRAVMKQPGFVWDARMAMLPGLKVNVHDAYIAGEGILNPAIAGLFSLADFRGTGEIAEGELMRYFAESAMYPTALLPSQGVKWEAVDERSARATMSDRGHTITLLFRFGADGLIESTRAEARGRTIGDKIVPTPWEGRWFNYGERNGMRVPLDGEVAWVLPDQRIPYWRGHATRLDYE